MWDVLGSALQICFGLTESTLESWNSSRITLEFRSGVLEGRSFRVPAGIVVNTWRTAAAWNRETESDPHR